MTIITLTTDFGERDGYVGAMKGVLLSIAPDARLVDITHQIPPQDVRRAALVLLEACPYYPPETVHLIVVDPGVGTERRAIAVETQGGRFVAPDNGVLSYMLAHQPEFTAVALTNPSYHRPDPSHTFHGRDIFSPAAAHLAGGCDLHDLGPVITDLVQLPLPRPTVSSSSIQGEILTIDHFGNTLTNIQYLRWVEPNSLTYSPVLPGGDDALRPAFRADQAAVTAGKHTFTGIHPTYNIVPPGQPIAIVGSGGELELAINQGHAGDTLGLCVGDPVTLHIQ